MFLQNNSIPVPLDTNVISAVPETQEMDQGNKDLLFVNEDADLDFKAEVL